MVTMITPSPHHTRATYYHRSFRQLSVAAAAVSATAALRADISWAIVCIVLHAHSQYTISFEWKWVLIYMALFIIQWQIQQVCQFLPIFHFQYSFNAVAIVRSLLSLPVYKIHFKTRLCVRVCVRGEGESYASWQVPVSCCSCQLQVATLSFRLPVQASERTNGKE